MKKKMSLRNKIPDARRLPCANVKLGVKKPGLGEFFSLLQNNRLFPHLKS
jgi:hypothetical protein